MPGYIQIVKGAGERLLSQGRSSESAQSGQAKGSVTSEATQPKRACLLPHTSVRLSVEQYVTWVRLLKIGLFLPIRKEAGRQPCLEPSGGRQSGRAFVKS